MRGHRPAIINCVSNPYPGHKQTIVPAIYNTFGLIHSYHLHDKQHERNKSLKCEYLIRYTIDTID